MEIICLCGKICSGKDYFGDIAQQLGPEKTISVNVSRFVKEILQTEERTHNASINISLADAIVGELISWENQGYKKVIIKGARQLSILQRIQATFDDVRLIWIESDDNKRSERFAQRNEARDVKTLEEYDIADRDLGLGQVEEFIKLNYPKNLIEN